MNETRLRAILRFRGVLWLLALTVCGCNREPVASGQGPSATATPPVQPSNVVAAAPPSVTTAEPEPVVSTNLVKIPAGSFVRLKHKVTLRRDFWMGRFEVTQAEFESLMGRNPSHFQGRTNAPVEKVTYFDAMAYCRALTGRERQAGRLPARYEYRLPTEAEWEYACRAGTTNLFSFGDGSPEAYAWTWENSESTTHPIGQKLPNPWGLYDIHGNVWEWCLDWFTNYPAADTVDPRGPAQGKHKVFRGGGWNNEAQFARSANRFMMAPNSGIHFVGFRVALCVIPPASASTSP